MRHKLRVNAIELKYFICVSVIIPGLVVAGASLTKGYTSGMSVHIYDAFGAALAGFMVQILAMKLGEPYLDKLT